MKRRLNILCLLVVLVLGYSIFDSAYQFGLGVKAGIGSGFDAGIKNNKKELEKLTNAKPVALIPDSYHLFTDSILNEKTGEYVPVMYSQMVVSVKTVPNHWQLFVTGLLSFAHLFVVLVAIVIFIRLIISINKSDIFNWRNVRRLRWLGAMLIFSFICSTVPAWIMSYALADVFSMKGYTLNLSEFVSITNLVLGFSAFIVGEVFAIGLRMKEEQELTI